MAKPAYYAASGSGSTGPDTALIQTWLNGSRDPCTHFDPVQVDGLFGPDTVKAVQEFQLRNDLKADGKVGPLTWNALHTKYAAANNGSEQYPGIAMKSGQDGAAVKSAQHQLNRKGASLTADGRFGGKTASAVRRFQQANSLPADGVIGPTTWAALYR